MEEALAAFRQTAKEAAQELATEAAKETAQNLAGLRGRAGPALT